MKKDFLFFEKQKFNQLWLWFLILVPFLYILIYFLNHRGSDLTTLIVVSCTLILSILILVIIKLETIIKKEGIHIRFFPFHIKYRQYAWSDISKLYMRKYDAISEYGGWGIRINLRGKGKAFNVSGNNGLQLEFKNNKKILIGTQKPEELIKALKKINKL